MAAGDLTPIQGTVDQGNPFAYGTNQQVRLSQLRSQFIDQVQPTKAELVRMGKVFATSGGVIANGVIPVLAMPTTATMDALYNGNTIQSNICLVILKISNYACSGTLGLGRSLICGVTNGPQAAIPAKGTGVVGPLNQIPTSTNVSNAIHCTSVAATTAPGWVTVGGLSTPAAVEVGASITADLEGLFIVPPTYMFCAHVFAPTGTTAKFRNSFMWAEYQVIPQ